MSVDYPFKRNFYYDVEKAIQKSNVTILLGAKGCGKTVCMKQLLDSFSEKEDFEKVIYFDAKKETSTIQKVLFMKQVISSIKKEEKILYLIDETSYLNMPDTTILELQDTFDDFPASGTKIVFTGNPLRALEYWGHHAFAENAVFIRAEFLSYSEWLVWRGFSEVSASSYKKFIEDARNFYPNFQNTREYLDSCLKETSNANARSSEIIYDNECYDLTAEILLNVLYASLMIAYSRSKNIPEDSVFQHFVKDVLQIEEKNFQNRIAEFLSERYYPFKKMDSYILSEALQFLEQCDFITLNPVADSSCSVKKLLSRKSESKSNIMEQLNIYIKYPMFYLDILQSLEYS